MNHSHLASDRHRSREFLRAVTAAWRLFCCPVTIPGRSWRISLSHGSRLTRPFTTSAQLVFRGALTYITQVLNGDESAICPPAEERSSFQTQKTLFLTVKGLYARLATERRKVEVGCRGNPEARRSSLAAILPEPGGPRQERVYRQWRTQDAQMRVHLPPCAAAWRASDRSALP